MDKNIYENMLGVLNNGTGGFDDLIAEFNVDDMADNSVLQEKFAKAEEAYWGLIDYIERKTGI